mgnify:CR=1 FL=1
MREQLGLSKSRLSNRFHSREQYRTECDRTRTAARQLCEQFRARAGLNTWSGPFSCPKVSAPIWLARSELNSLEVTNVPRIVWTMNLTTGRVLPAYWQNERMEPWNWTLARYRFFAGNWVNSDTALLSIYC